MKTSLNILLVDDDPTNLIVLETQLHGMADNLVKATSGREAYQQSLHTEFAVILLDVSMPELDGFETAALIRQWGKNRETPILFLTAVADEGMLFHGYRAGAVDYLIKPVVAEVLQIKVGTFLALAQRNAEAKEWAAALKTANTALEQEIALRRRAEDTLASANRDLEDRVQKRTASLASSEGEVRRLLLMAEESRQALSSALREQQRSAAELHALYDRLQLAREEERASVAREIHDVLAQELTRLKMDIMWLDRRLTPPVRKADQENARQKLAEMKEVADAAIKSVQHIATSLRPLVLDSLGLVAAMEWQAKEFQQRTGITCDLVAEAAVEEIVFEPGCATALFRIAQESLTNVARHAQAGHVRIELSRELGQITLKVRDDGRGIPAAALNDLRSLGLLGMRERCALMGGRFEISGAPGHGTLINVRIPQPAAAKGNDEDTSGR